MKLGFFGMLWGWGLQEDSKVGYCMEREIGALQGTSEPLWERETLAVRYFVVGRCTEGEENIDFPKSDNPTLRVGKCTYLRVQASRGYSRVDTVEDVFGPSAANELLHVPFLLTTSPISRIAHLFNCSRGDQDGRLMLRRSVGSPAA